VLYQSGCIQAVFPGRFSVAGNLFQEWHRVIGWDMPLQGEVGKVLSEDGYLVGFCDQPAIWINTNTKSMSPN
jgi:hypothetical protein